MSTDRTDPQGAPAPRVAVAALVVSVLAFVTGWVPGVGLVLGAAGLVLGYRATRSGRPGALPVVACVLSGLAVLASLLVTTAVVLS